MAKGNSKFLRQKPMEHILDKTLNSVSRGGGAIGAMYVQNTVLPKWTKKDGANAGQPVIKKSVSAPLLLLLGLAAEVMVEQHQVEAVAQGVQTGAMLSMYADMVLKDDAKKAEFGLNGIGANETPTNEAQGGGLDYDAIYAEAFANAANTPDQANEQQPYMANEKAAVNGTPDGQGVVVDF